MAIPKGIELTFGGKKQNVDALLEELFGEAFSYNGVSTEIPGSVTLALQPIPLRKGALAGHLVTILLELGGGVATSLVASYLYSALTKHRKKEIRTFINRRELHITKSGLVKLIEETIERSEAGDPTVREKAESPFTLQVDVADAKQKQNAEKLMKLLGAPEIPVVIDPGMARVKKEMPAEARARKKKRKRNESNPGLLGSPICELCF